MNNPNRSVDSLMKRARRNAVGCILGAAVILCTAVPAGAKTPFKLTGEDIVVFAGGTNMLHLQQAGHLETILAKAAAPAKARFRDLSWEADTVFRLGTDIERWRKDGFGRRDEQFKRVGATVFIAQFGQLESLQGSGGVARFAEAYGKLLDAFSRQARLVVLVSPPPFEKPPSDLIPDLSLRNADLALYVKATKALAEERKLLFVDLFTGAKGGLMDNGMHVTPEAQVKVAQAIAGQLGVKTPAAAALEPLRRAVIEKHRLWYDYWRPANWKLLYGDDSRRVFTRGGKDYIPFREEWKKLLPLIDKADERVWKVAAGGKDPGPDRPEPEKLHGDPGADIAKELEAFTVLDGFEVNLFASEHEGLTSPLAVRWDPSGRMYVTVTTVYPHVWPGDVPNDKIIAIEDTDNDGKADKSMVFADGLNIPTGIEWGDGGIYVGQNTELLFLKDTDGDGKADTRRVVLGGFGNGDSHQTINSFVWSPGGELFFGQGDGCESRVETPWGSSDLFQAGFYRFRPKRLQLHPLLDDFMGPGNPWGVAFDRWGQIFSIDGAGGVTYLSPGQIPSNHRHRIPTIGSPGGYCGIGFLDSRVLPKSIRTNFAIGDYKANRVKRFGVRPSGSGYSLKWKPHILQSKHRNFRPIDVKQGPDGAIYVVDWYNPITCHQDDAYRDPRRDKAHGRIWRVAAKGPAVKPVDLLKASLKTVVENLGSTEYWSRYQAKRALSVHPREEVAAELGRWVKGLDKKQSRYELRLYEALTAYATIEVVEPALLGRVLRSQDHRGRAYAARMVGRWHDRLDDPLGLLAERVLDEHPLVRMEATLACAAIPSAKSITIASQVVDRGVDRWIDYAFTQAAHQLQPHWSPAFQKGQISFNRPKHLAATLNKTGGRNVLNSLKQIAGNHDLEVKARVSASAAIFSVGKGAELQEYGLNRERFEREGKYDADFHAQVLEQLAHVARFRDVRPGDGLGELLNDLIARSEVGVKNAALSLAGIWKVEDTEDKVLEAAADKSLPVSVRSRAFEALASMGSGSAKKLLSGYAGASRAPGLRAAAIRSLAGLDGEDAARQAALLFAEADLGKLDAAPVLAAFLERKDGSEVLADALDDAKLKSAVAENLLRALYSTGRLDKALVKVLNKTIGVTGQVPDYNENYVNALVGEALKKGDSKRGALLFKSSACVTCHKVAEEGGVIGPDLAAIGSTLSPQRIVEELLWPRRQVKEGYTVVQVVTSKGAVHQGYERRTRDSQASGDLVMRELATEKLVTVKKEHIIDKRETGSPMPTGLTALLSRPQLLDLVRYLSELGKNK